MSSQSQCESQRKVKQQYVGTTMCKFYLAGTCKRGTACTFAHSQDQIRELPNYSKTRLCDAYMSTGHCEQGSACKFAHGREEMQRVAAERKRQHKQEKRAAKNNAGVAAKATNMPAAPAPAAPRAPAAPTASALAAPAAAEQTMAWQQVPMPWAAQMVQAPAIFMPLAMPAQYQHQQYAMCNFATSAGDDSTDCGSTHSFSSNPSSPRGGFEHRQVTPDNLGGLSPVEEQRLEGDQLPGLPLVRVKNTFLDVLESPPLTPTFVPRSKTSPEFC